MKLFNTIFDKVPKQKVTVVSNKSTLDRYYDYCFTPVNEYPELNKIAKALKKELSKKYA